MNMTIKELKNTRLFIDVLIALAGLVLFLSLFTTLYRADGVIYYDTDDVGEEMGSMYQEEMKVYNFVLPISTKVTHINYFSWEMSLLYILLFIIIIFNFIDIRDGNQIKQYIISALLIILSLILIWTIRSYKNELELIFDEFASMYFRTSYINVESGSTPFLAYSLSILAGILSFYKAWLVGKISQNDKKKRSKR